MENDGNDGVRFLTVGEIAAILRVSRMTIYRLCQTGVFPVRRVGRSYRVPAGAVADYLNGDDA